MMNLPPPASGRTTQAPSPHDDGPMGTEEAAPMPMATNMGTSMQAPVHQPEPHHQVVPAVPKYDLNEN